MAQTYTIALFGVTRDIVGSSTLTVSLTPPARVDRLLARLRTDFPRLNELNSLLVAVNQEYAEPEQSLRKGDEIALIPPVSGG